MEVTLNEARKLQEIRKQSAPLRHRRTSRKWYGLIEAKRESYDTHFYRPAQQIHVVPRLHLNGDVWVPRTLVSKCEFEREQMNRERADETIGVVCRESRPVDVEQGSLPTRTIFEDFDGDEHRAIQFFADHGVCHNLVELDSGHIRLVRLVRGRSPLAGGSVQDFLGAKMKLPPATKRRAGRHPRHVSEVKFDRYIESITPRVDARRREAIRQVIVYEFPGRDIARTFEIPYDSLKRQVTRVYAKLTDLPDAS